MSDTDMLVEAGCTVMRFMVYPVLGPHPWSCVPSSAGWHEELDRKLSQHSLGEMTKFGSKTALNRRVRVQEYVCVYVCVCVCMACVCV